MSAGLPPQLLYEIICCHPVQATAVLPAAVPLVRQQETVQATAQQGQKQKKQPCQHKQQKAASKMQCSTTRAAAGNSASCSTAKAEVRE
jgi:hypothetical protein